MKLSYHKDNIKMVRHYHLELKEGEFGMAKFDKFDLALLDEINAERKQKVSDILLGLELVARRIEEGHDTRQNRHQPI